MTGWEFWSNFNDFGQFLIDEIEALLENAWNIPQINFFHIPWLYFIEKTSKAMRKYAWMENNRYFADKSRNPEKIQNFVKKKSHSHKNALNQKSLCAKLLLHTKMNYTQGFCLIFNCFRVSFFFNSKFCSNMAEIAIIS